MESNQSVNVVQAREKLQNLIANQSPDLRLLNELKQELAQAVEAGVTVKEIWTALREAGFAGNQMKLSGWLEAQGIRKKMASKGNGSSRKRKKEAETTENQS